jgi:hypothetical protein
MKNKKKVIKKITESQFKKLLKNKGLKNESFNLGEELGLDSGMISDIPPVEDSSLEGVMSDLNAIKIALGNVESKLEGNTQEEPLELDMGDGIEMDIDSPEEMTPDMEPSVDELYEEDEIEMDVEPEVASLEDILPLMKDLCGKLESLIGDTEKGETIDDMEEGYGMEEGHGSLYESKRKRKSVFMSEDKLSELISETVKKGRKFKK